MIKNLFRNLLSKSKGYADTAESNAIAHTEAKLNTGTFTIPVPRLNNQVVSFNYIRLFDKFTVGWAYFKANTVSGNATIYFPFADNNPFGFNIDSISGICQLDSTMIYPCSESGGNTNLWIPIPQSTMSARNVFLTIFVVGGVILNLLNALSERGCVA